MSSFHEIRDRLSVGQKELLDLESSARKLEEKIATPAKSRETMQARLNELRSELARVRAEIISHTASNRQRFGHGNRDTPRLVYLEDRVKVLTSDIAKTEKQLAVGGVDQETERQLAHTRTRIATMRNALATMKPDSSYRKTG